MNISGISAYRQNLNTALPKSEQTLEKSSASQAETPAAVVTISEQARQAIEAGYQSDVNKYNILKEKENSDAQIKAAEDMLKCLEIARRISSGAKVPSTDHEKLMKYSFKLYMIAVQSAAMNKSDEEYDSLFEDEEKADGEQIMSPEDIGAESRKMLEAAEASAAAELPVEAEAAPAE